MWSFKIILVLILCLYSALTYAQASKNFFRKDYTYFESTKSFYKIHTIHKSWHDAKKTCSMEGASLFYPENENEANVVTEFLIKTQPFSWVFVGASALIVKGVYETIYGVPVLDLYHKWAPGEPNDGYTQDCMVLRKEGTLHDENCAAKYPFICKKTLSSLEWDYSCNMPNSGYKHSADVGRCYKFHTNPLSWTDAYATCSAELSYLAVIDDPIERNILVNLTTKKVSENAVTANFSGGAVHLGFHNLANEGWSTIKGMPLSTGYSDWSIGEPNGASRQKCGSMYYNGYLNDIECEKRCFFICEHNVVYNSITRPRTEDDSESSSDDLADVDHLLPQTI